MPGHTVDHIFLNKLHTYRQLKELKKKNYDIFVNLCEGYLDWAIPSIDVIYTLDLLNLPYTRPNTDLYDPPKELMKYVAFTCGIATPDYVAVENTENIESEIQFLHFPLFVKPAKAGDSLGIDAESFVENIGQLKKKVLSLLNEYDEILIEEYMEGRI